MDKLELFSCKNISKSFDNNKTFALKSVDILLNNDESIALVGESGCGKSTLSRIIMKLSNPSEGELFFQGKNVTNLKNNERKSFYKSIQMVFQDPLSTFNPKMKIKTYLNAPYRYFKLENKDTAREDIKKSLETVKLPVSYLEKYPHELSGGELQRVVIARAISIKPKLIIFDEATSALDMTIQAEIVSLLKELKEIYKFSMIFITHDLALADQICNRVYVMKDGKIVEMLNTGNIICEASSEYTRNFFSQCIS